MSDLDAFLDIKFPSTALWSPDGRYLAYQLTGPKGSDIHIYCLADKSTWALVTGITPYRYAAEAPDLRWSSDGKKVVYRTGRDYYGIPMEGAEPELFVGGTLLGELVQLSPDQRMVSFIREGDLWIQPINGGGPRQLTKGEEFLRCDPDPWALDLFMRLYQWPQWSPDSSKIAYLARMLHGFKVVVVSTDGHRVSSIVPDEDTWGLQIITWSPDSEKVAIGRLRLDYRRKELVVADISGGETRPLWASTDEKWVDRWDGPRFDVSWSRDSRRIAFLANPRGWRHLYTAVLDTGEVCQLTAGEYDLHGCWWSPVGREIALASSEGDLQQCLPRVIPAGGGQAMPLVEQPGICKATFASSTLGWSPDGRYLAFSLSGPDEPPGLWLASASAATAPNRLHQSLPACLDQDDIAHMEAASFSSADGTQIPAVLITPSDLKRDERHPALVYMYGAIGQCASLGWGLGNKSILFNYLATKGYIILVVDPRGSEGYGPNHAKGLYRESGGKQIDDLVAGAGYLSSLGYIDPRAIGIFGHSWGGCLAVQTVLKEPDVFAACVSMAGVYDWDDYGSRYNPDVQIGFGPADEEPCLRRERSAVHNVDRLTVPLLLFHGTADFNVPIRQSERLVESLLRVGKDFEYMVYPGEPHDWVNEETIRDFFKRTEDFLDRNLKHGL